MSSEHEYLEIEDFDRVPKKHKRMRKDGEPVSQALVDKVRIFFLNSINKVDRYGVYLPNHITTYSYIKGIVGEKASKVIKVLIDEGFVKKIQYPRDETAMVDMEGLLTKIEFKEGRWTVSAPNINDYFWHSPDKVHKSLRKYYKRGWGDRWRLRASTLSKKAEAQFKKDLEKLTPNIKWDEVGYQLSKGEAFRTHGIRLGYLEPPKSGECPHCEMSYPSKADTVFTLVDTTSKNAVRRW